MEMRMNLSRKSAELKEIESGLARATVILFLALTLPMLASAHPPDDDHVHHEKAASVSKHGSLAETGAKLSNPVSDVWALFTEFDLNFNNGNANQGDDKIGSLMNFQPILPIPIFGKGEDRWQVLIRPAVPIQFAAPRPDGINNTNYDAGLADILFPALLTPSQKITGSNLIFGVGPTLAIPTSTKVQLGRRQWQMGPAAVVGYKTKDYVVGVFPQYFWGVGGRGDQGSDIENASNMNLLYFGFLNLPKAWQVGMNPVIIYDHKASRGNKWNVPVGLVVAKTTRIGKMPVKFQLGAEYSVVSQDDFGKRFLIKLNIIPVIGALVRSPIFGGGD
jgi:hypothetical protein